MSKLRTSPLSLTRLDDTDGSTEEPTATVPRVVTPSTELPALTRDAMVAIIRYAASSLEAGLVGGSTTTLSEKIEDFERIVHGMEKRSLEAPWTIDGDTTKTEIIREFLASMRKAVRDGGGGGDDPADILQGGEG